jgi:4-hydroxy-2-oxoglutarate aldolase
MKESGSDIGQIAEYVTLARPDFTVLAGSATTLFHALCAGCDGAVLAVAALLPDRCIEIQSLVLAGNVEAARALQRQITPLARSVGGTYGVAGLKAALDLLGYGGGLPRPPLRPVTPQIVDIIRGQLEALGALASPEPART